MMLLLLAYQAEAQTIIRFQPHISPQAQHLGDLLVITDDKNHLANTPLDSQPRDGQKITKKQITSWIKSKRGTFHYKWRGKNTAVIHQLIQTAGVDLLNKAQSTLKNQLEKEEYSHIELTTKTKLKSSSFPLSAFIAHTVIEYPITKQVCVRLKFGKHSIPVWFSVKAYQKILVAQHKIKNNTLVHEEDFILQERNIAGLKDKPFTKLPQTGWLKKSMNTNQILTQKHLTEPPAIIKGQVAQVNVLNHRVSIVITAIAQNNGYIGQTIRMKNPQTNKYFVAVITGLNQAEVPS